MTEYESDLPDELQGGRVRTPAPYAHEDDDKQQLLDQLGLVIAGKRDEAVKARKESGIEDVWMQCEQAYIGMDAANAHEFQKAKWAKPTTSDGPVTAAQARETDNKSTVFIKLTSRYVDAGYAKLAEIVLPIDGKAFKFNQTPVPELVVKMNDLRQVIDDAPDGTGMPLTRAPKPDEVPADPNAPPQPQVPLTVKDLAEEKVEQSRKAAEKAEQRVYDWMVESKYPLQARKMLFDSARIGVGVLKGPFPESRKSRAVTVQGDAIALQIKQKVSPSIKWTDPWNVFPDGACGENIHDGDYFFERDFLTERRLKDLKKQKTSTGHPIYMADCINKVIEEGPEKCNIENGNPNDKRNKKRFTIWYGYVNLSRKDLEVANAIGHENLPEELLEVSAIVTMVNDTIIRATLNPLESGGFPYRVMPWSRRAGHWAGVGVAEQVDAPQRIVNGGTRRLLENAGKSAGAQLVMDPDVIVPADKNWTITPDKLWFKVPGATMDDVRKAFMNVVIQNVGDQLMKIIEYGFRLAEEASAIPLVAQGQDGPTTPQTFGQAELQNTNAHTMLRSKAYAVDDYVTEPLVNDMYEWLLMDPDVPNDEKGDFQIDAHGSIVLVEKAIQEQFLIQQAQIVLDPRFGVDPKKWYAEVMVAKRLDAKKISFTEQEQKKLESQPPPEDPIVTAAKIREQGATERAKTQQDTSLQKIKVDTDRDTAFVTAQAERNANEHTERMAELAQRERIAMLEYSTKKDISMDELKVMLAKTTMELQTQAQLAGADGKGPQVATPPTEPPGRAPNGEAYQK